jgi:hypothetical protein
LTGTVVLGVLVGLGAVFVLVGAVRAVPRRRRPPRRTGWQVTGA